MVISTLGCALGGEIFIPKLSSYRIIDIAEAIGPSCRQEIIGMRPGEKIHEEMITENDSYNTLELGRQFAILPTTGKLRLEEYMQQTSAIPVKPGFTYNSGGNPNFLTVDRLRTLIRENVDLNFQPIYQLLQLQA